ncbi:hypothetical protein [Thermocrispum sp.]|uniref:Acg family FMN-binding oxidoreductase n=1 Tax=Thermocrispum sp. TaxID=2060768 RepID=UPI00257DD601|nr:hypothetical protein [Thermocrispum sp.]
MQWCLTLSLVSDGEADGDVQRVEATMSALAPEVTEALGKAVQAPSPYNTQPWRFVVDGERIDLFLDPERVLRVSDPDGRQARLACGAALFNLRLGIRVHGRAVVVDLVPDPEQPDLLASVRISGPQAKTLTEDRLARAIERRHTNRRPFLNRQVEPPLRSGLVAAARAEGALVELVDPEGKTAPRYRIIAELVRQADSVQQNDPEYQWEARRWSGGGPERADGVPASAFGPEPDDDRVLRLRSFPRDTAPPRREFEQQPLVAAVLTYGKGIAADVVAGMAMQRVLLTASDLGLSTSFLTQPFEVPQTRAQLTELFRPHQIHTLLRVGYGYPVAPTPRRAVDEVTVRT